MSGSYIFLLHLLGFGFAGALLTANIVLERAIRQEPDWSNKLYIGRLGRTFGMISPLTVAVLLLTGIGNIYNRYVEASEAWYTEGWLVAKIILFVILATNGFMYGPQLARKRMQLIKAIADKTASADAEHALKNLNSQVLMFLFVQTVLLVSIVYLSTFGGAKHPGIV
jgi:uncharacterized protein YacL